MSTVSFPGYARKARQAIKRLRNGRYPEASVVTFMQEETNRIAMYRVKGWSFFQSIGAIPATDASRDRWVFAFRSSTHASYLWVRFIMAPSNVATNASARLQIRDSADAIVAEATAHGGNQTASDTPANFDIINVPTNDGTAVVTIDPDTDYFAYVTDLSGGRVVACVVWEVAMLPDTANGYLSNGVVAGQDIFDNHRGDMTSMLRNTWKNGTPLITWSADTEAGQATNNTGTDKNIIDDSTAVSVASPGFTLNLTNHSTLRRSDIDAACVPCIMKVYGDTSGGGTVGTIKLKDSGGNTVATVTITAVASADDWYTSAPFNLIDALDKYDITSAVASGAGTVSTWAVSIYAYEA